MIQEANEETLIRVSESAAIPPGRATIGARYLRAGQDRGRDRGPRGGRALRGAGGRGSLRLQVRDAGASWLPGKIAEETKPHRRERILRFYSLAKQDTVCYTCSSRLHCKIVKA